ncbi:hypothetical protein LIER_32850 [Lithospermum erythrorhizon]|uniref:Uncharacterized protein n=1 Tax=Lithospermum erythrorhizon TaxID=34254 RepID=A0AAV3RYW4_LITER
MEASDEAIYQAHFQIPYDVFVTKKHHLFPNRGYLMFTDSFGNLVYRVEPQQTNKLLLDASGNCLISLHHLQRGSWKGFQRSDSSNELFFRVERTVNELTRTEFEIFLVGGEHGKDSKTNFKMKGSPFKRSCTIYKDNSIVAETSLMYKLGMKKIFVPRTRFRVTLFPVFADHPLVVALLIIFFNGRKFWV